MIPLFTLRRQHRKIGRELESAIARVITRDRFILGPEVSAFEREFAKYLNVKYAVGVASGTDALSLALLSLGVEREDEVIIPANAYPTAFAVTAIGARPCLADCNPLTYTIDPQDIIKKITKKTKAIIPVHLYGHPADMKKILQIGKREKIAVVEDCAQASGATLVMTVSEPDSGSAVKGGQKSSDLRQSMEEKTREKKVGSLADVGCFSFYPTKNIGALGDGGMVVTDNPEIYELVKKLRMYGEQSRYHSTMLGRNSRLDELQAALLRVKLAYLDSWNERRREIARAYRQNLQGISVTEKADELQFPHEAPSARHVYHLYVTRCKKRDKLRQYLEERGIGTGVHYPVPLHLVPSFRFLGYRRGDFPQSEQASNEVLSWPMYPELKGKEVQTVCSVTREFYETC